MNLLFCSILFFSRNGREVVNIITLRIALSGFSGTPGPVGFSIRSCGEDGEAGEYSCSFTSASESWF